MTPNRKLYCLLASFCVVFAVLFTGRLSAGEPLRVGACQRDITPTEFPVCVNGYFTPRYVSEVHDPLFAKALAIECGRERFVFVLIDSCHIPSAFTDRVKAQIMEKTGFPADRICISATHTHFAPAICHGHETSEGIPSDEELQDLGIGPYEPTALAGAVEAVTGALDRLEPALFGWCTAREPRHVFCRRFLMKPGTAPEQSPDLVEITHNVAQMNPPRQSEDIISPLGVPDQTIYCLAFARPDGTPIALLANYSSHYAGGPDIEGRLSADYYGVFARKIAELLGADENFVAMMTCGTAGDCNCIDFLSEQPPYDYNVVGEHLAEKVFAAYGKMQFADTASLRVRTDTLELALRRPTAEQVEKVRALLASSDDLPVVTRCYAKLTIAEASFPKRWAVTLQTVALNDIGLCAAPGEIYSFTGARLRTSTPFDANVMIGLANGYNGYIPPADQFELGGYTTWRGTSMLEREAEPKIRAKLLAMLRDIAAADSAGDDAGDNADENRPQE